MTGSNSLDIGTEKQELKDLGMYGARLLEVLQGSLAEKDKAEQKLETVRHSLAEALSVAEGERS